MALATPRTWVTGELVTAAMMNTDVRDRLDNASAQSVQVATYTLTTTADSVITGLSITVNEEGGYLAILKGVFTCVGAGDNNITFALKTAVASGGSVDVATEALQDVLTDGRKLTLTTITRATSTDGQNMLIEGRAWKGLAGTGTSTVTDAYLLVGLIYWL